MKPTKTEILGYDGNIPILKAIPRKDWPPGLRTYCQWCKRYHLHGMGEGHRTAHCYIGSNSPFKDSGYILKVMPE